MDFGWIWDLGFGRVACGIDWDWDWGGDAGTEVLILV